MNLSVPNSLVLVSGAIDFLLHISLAFAVCLLVCGLLSGARSRFVVWLSFLVASTGYWLWLSAAWVRLCWPRAELVFPAVSNPVDLPAMGSVLAHSAEVLSVSQRLATALSWAVASLAVAYGGVVLYRLTASVRSHLKLRAVLRFTANPSLELAASFEDVRQASGVAGKDGCRLGILAGIGSPATVGWLRPMILLPEGVQASSGLADILRHELHHVRRRDFLWDNVAGFCASLLCFHPAVHFAMRRLRFERELACDLAVISESPGRRAEYAECLLHFARREREESRLAWGIDFAARSGHLKARLRGILAGDRHLPAWLAGLRGTTALLFLIGTLAVLPAVGVQLRLATAPVARMLDRAGISAPAPVMHRLMKRALHPVVQEAAVAQAGMASGADQTLAKQETRGGTLDVSSPARATAEVSQSRTLEVREPQSQDDAQGGPIPAMAPASAPAGIPSGTGAVVIRASAPVNVGRAGTVPWVNDDARSKIGFERRRRR